MAILSGVGNNQIMNVTPALQTLVQTSTDKLGSIANFVVDNNPEGVAIVLRANGYTFNTPSEQALIVRSILSGTDSKSQGVLSQLSQVPYVNNNTNGTGGLKGAIGGEQFAGLGDQLLCTVGTLFGYPIGCTGSNLTPEQLQAQQAQALAAQQARQRQTILIVSILAGVILIVTIIYFKNKK